jgi:hypothetical protein
VLQDVGGIRRVPGKQPEVSITADVLKLSLCSAALQATGPVVNTSDTLKSRTFPFIAPPPDGLSLDVRLVSLLHRALPLCGCSASTGRIS